MAKLIVLVLVGLVVYSLYKNHRRRVDGGGTSTPPPVESMVRCAQCGVHHPRSESYLSNGKFFCSAEHQRLAQSR